MRTHLAALAAFIVSLVAPVALAADLPPGEADAKAALEKSPRHGEWVEIARGGGGGAGGGAGGAMGGATPIKAYVVYPERAEKAPVVIVIHEIFGLTDWIRSVADQLAADGFIAVAPDLLSGHGKDGGGTDSLGGRDAVTKAIRELKPDEVNASLDAVRAFATKLPAADGKSAVIGFCWGGSASFAYAAHQPEIQAAVVYYGTSPDRAAIEKIKAPVLGLYGGNDARVNATIAPAETAARELGKSYEPHVFEGAGHGFLRQQNGQNGANQKAAEQA